MKPVKHYNIELPCKPYVKKYITSVFGDHSVPGSPILASKKTILGLHIEASLSKERYTYPQEYRQFREFFLEPIYTAKLLVRVSQWQFDHIGFSFSDEKIIELNQFMECLFEQHLCDWISARLTPGVERKSLLEEFAALHDISLDVEDGDISIETLRKTEYRKRVHIEKHKARPFEFRSQGRPRRA